MPGVTVALWSAVQAGDHLRALQIHRDLLTFRSTINGDTLPGCVKHAIGLQGCEVGVPRQPMPAPTDAQKARIAAALPLVLRHEEAHHRPGAPERA